MNLITATLLVTVAVLNVSALYDQSDDAGIYNGKLVEIKEANFLASIRSKSQFKCAGSIIDNQYILTLAHCVPQQASEYKIHTGSNKPNGEGDVYDVEKIIKHEKYDAVVSQDYDIALVKVANKINFNENVSNTKLPAKDLKLPAYANLNIYGWGLKENDSVSTALLKCTVPTMAKTECRKSYGNLLTPRMICTGEREKGFADGDSGGPAIYNNAQVAIIGFADKPWTMYPQAYTYLPPLMDWVYENMAINR